MASDPHSQDTCQMGDGMDLSDVNAKKTEATDLAKALNADEVCTTAEMKEFENTMKGGKQSSSWFHAERTDPSTYSRGSQGSYSKGCGDFLINATNIMKSKEKLSCIVNRNSSTVTAKSGTTMTIKLSTDFCGDGRLAEAKHPSEKGTPEEQAERQRKIDSGELSEWKSQPPVVANTPGGCLDYYKEQEQMRLDAALAMMKVLTSLLTINGEPTQIKSMKSTVKAMMKPINKLTSSIGDVNIKNSEIKQTSTTKMIVVNKAALKEDVDLKNTLIDIAESSAQSSVDQMLGAGGARSNSKQIMSTDINEQSRQIENKIKSMLSASDAGNETSTEMLILSRGALNIENTTIDQNADVAMMVENLSAAAMELGIETASKNMALAASGQTTSTSTANGESLTELSEALGKANAEAMRAGGLGGQIGAALMPIAMAIVGGIILMVVIKMAMKSRN